jgi:hypothetical protein
VNQKKLKRLKSIQKNSGPNFQNTDHKIRDIKNTVTIRLFQKMNIQSLFIAFYKLYRTVNKKMSLRYFECVIISSLSKYRCNKRKMWV